MTDSVSTEKQGVTQDAIGFTGWLDELEAERHLCNGLMKGCGKKKNRLMEKYYQGRSDTLGQVIDWMRSRSSNDRR
jgi:hypothetical protein